MRILFISSFFGVNLGGAEKSINILAESLKKQGVGLVILTTRKLINIHHENNVRQIINTTWIPNRFLIVGNRLLDYFLANRLEKTIIDLRQKIDVIHVQDLYLLPAAVSVSKLLKIPLVFTLRDTIPKFVRDGEYNFLIVKLSNILFKFRNKVWFNCIKQVDYIVTISNFLKYRIKKRGIDVGRVVTIYNSATKWDKRIRLINDINRPVIIFAPGRLYKDKGFDILLKAFKLVNNSKEIQLLIAGDGPFKKALIKLVRTLRLGNSVKFLGKVPHSKIKNLYIKSDIVVFTPIYDEAFGRVALEGMMAAKPIIASKIGGIPEIVVPNKTGLLVEPYNVQRLAKAMTFLIKNKKLSIEMGKRGRMFAIKKFNSEKIANYHINLYNKLIKMGYK